MVIDFHIHSKYSFDCFREPSKIIEDARRAGIEGLAITDHDTMEGVEVFRSIAPDIYIIAGQEISTRDGDVLGLFLKKEIKNCLSAQEAIASVRGQGGLAVLAHPFKWPYLRRSAELLKQFDAIEVFNARNNIPFPFLENYLAKKAAIDLKLAVVAGSDTHKGFEFGNARTVFDFSCTEATDDKIKKAILDKRVDIQGHEVALAPEVVSHFSRLFRSCLKK